MTADFAYYNEIDPFCCEWLRKLIRSGSIMDGEVDERPIEEVRPEDVMGFVRQHYFAGLAGWDLALQYAGWPGDMPVVTGSAPCQPYSSAGKQLGDADPRNLWPDFFRLIRECQPPVLFGEQVASAIRHGWLDGVCRDLETEGYACGAAVLGAHSAGAPHIRKRLYWLGYSTQRGQRINGSTQRDARYIAQPNTVDGLDISDCSRSQSRRTPTETAGRGSAIEPTNGVGGLADASQSGLPLPQQPMLPGPQRYDQGRAIEQPGGVWSDYYLVHCRDGKTRRIGSRVQPLADGIPRDLGRRFAQLSRMVSSARANRVGRLRAYGNAIVPEVAAEFIKAFMEIRDDR